MLTAYTRTKEDIAYEQQRNRLIPVAEKIANKAYGKKPKGCEEATLHEWAEKWDSCFHRALSNMAKEL